MNKSVPRLFWLFGTLGALAVAVAARPLPGANNAVELGKAPFRAATLVLVPQSQTISTDSVTTVDLELDDAGMPVTSVNLRLDYTPNLLALTGVSLASGICQQPATPSVDTNDGTLALNCQIEQNALKVQLTTLLGLNFQTKGTGTAIVRIDPASTILSPQFGGTNRLRLFSDTQLTISP
jgi:hypothetical protein